MTISLVKASFLLCLIMPLRSFPPGFACVRPITHKKNDIFQYSIAIGAQLLIDCLSLCKNMFCVESLAIVGITLPCYSLARHYDERLQRNFYQPHKNIHQLPKWCHVLAQCSIGIPFVGLSCLTFLSSHKERALTGYLTAIGWPIMQSGKDIIKSLDYTFCLRPWHEHFNSAQRAMGGFPSGHLASISYMTTLWGLQEGVAWAVPLGLLGLFIGVDFLTSNRHYLSQLIAGSALGVLFAYAAQKVVYKKLSEHWYVRPYFDKTIGLCITYSV